MLRDLTNCSLKLKVDHILRRLGILENGLKWDYCFQHVISISTQREPSRTIFSNLINIKTQGDFCL